MKLNSEWHSCGGTDPTPASSISFGATDLWKAYCSVGFWGSFSYSLTNPAWAGDAEKTVTVSYSTFSGNSSCTVNNAGSFFFNCAAGNSSLSPVNPNASGEHWHYENFVDISG